MALRFRQLLAPTLAACAAAAMVAWLGLATAAFTDYEKEAEPALDALRAGHLQAFLELSPSYGGSLLQRAPFALLPSIWGGGADAVFYSMAVPCLAVSVALAVGLFTVARRAGGRTGAWGVLLLVAANPLTLRALFIGHPEELLVSSMLIASALLAAHGRVTLAGLLLGLAAAGKPWAAIGAVPVLALLPDARAMLRAAFTAAVAGGLVLVPFLLAGAGAVHEATAVASTSGSIFKPCQLFWFFGDHGQATVGLFQARPGYRIAPEWVAQLSHPAIVVGSLVLATLGAVMLRRRRAPWTDGLLLLAAVLLLRCLLDTWNVEYYALPFVFALVAWEAATRGTALLATAATLVCWLSYGTISDYVSPDVQAAVYLAWAVPLFVALSWRVLSGRWSPIQTARPIARTLPAASSTALAP